VHSVKYGSVVILFVVCCPSVRLTVHSVKYGSVVTLTVCSVLSKC
jgi:hypothetical protein